MKTTSLTGTHPENKGLPADTAKESAAIPDADANLRIAVEHPFTTAKLSVWIDGKLKYSEALHGKEKKKLLVFHKTEGRTLEEMSIPAGKHSIKVRVQSPEQNYDLANSIVASLADKETRILNVRCEKEEVRLLLQ